MKRLWLVFAQSVTVLLAALFVVATLKPEWLNRKPTFASVVPVLEAPAPRNALPATNSFSAAARAASPAVVSINTSKAAEAGSQNADPWFRFFFGEQGKAQPRGLHPDEQPRDRRSRPDRGDPQRWSQKRSSSDRDRSRNRSGDSEGQPEGSAGDHAGRFRRPRHWGSGAGHRQPFRCGTDRDQRHRQRAGTHTTRHQHL